MRGFICIHFAAMLAIFLAFWFPYYRLPSEEGAYFMHDRTIIVSYTLLLFTMSHVYNCYSVGIFRVGELVYSQTIGNLICWGITYILACVMAQQLLNPLMGGVAFFLQTVFCVVWTVLANRVYFRLHKPKKTVVIFRNENDLRKLEEVAFFEHKWHIVKRIQCRDLQTAHYTPDTVTPPFEVSPSADHVVDFDIAEIMQLLSDCETVFVSGISATLRNGIAKYCVEHKKTCFFVPHAGDVLVAGGKHIRSFVVPIIKVQKSNPSPEYLILKRTSDILISLIFLALCSPIMAITAIAIKAYDRGPVLYKQIRLTKNGKQFQILKFRSMGVDAEKDGVARLSSGKNDNRITPIGKIIRATRIDELPQLFNILMGDMSLVGPRPERPEIAAEYQKVLPAFSLRLQVKAGLTGYAQIYGRYNTEPADKLKMDLMYINNMGIAEDLKLMFATVRIWFKKESTEGVCSEQTTALSSSAEEAEEKEEALL